MPERGNLMKTIEELKQEKNQVISDMEQIIEQGVVEVRNLNDSEQSKLDELQARLNQIKSELKERREEVHENSKMEEREMDKKLSKEELEIRAIEQFITHREGKEYREVTSTTTTSANSNAIKADYIFNEIVRQLEEVAPLFAEATRYTSTDGTLSIPVEDAGNLFDFGFVGEDVDVAEHILKFSNVKLTQHRVGACVKLTRQLMNDASIDIVGYTTHHLLRRLGATLDKEMVTGVGTGEHFQGLAGVTGVETVEGSAINADLFMDAIHKIHPTMLPGAKFVMSRAMFNAVAKLKDASGQYLLMTTRDITGEQPHYSIFNVPVAVTDAMTGVTSCYLVNVREAFGVMIKKDAQLIRINSDTQNALKATELFVMDMYADCKCKNKQAIVKVEIKTTQQPAQGGQGGQG